MILDQLVEPAGVVVETLPGLLGEVVLIFETGHILNIRDQEFATKCCKGVASSIDKSINKFVSDDSKW